MRATILTVLVGLLAGCTNAYWDRPGATLPVLARESGGCYRDAVDMEAPAAWPGPSGGPQLLPRSTPPPKLWARAPRDAALEHFGEQMRYERCMVARGWVKGPTAVPTR